MLVESVDHNADYTEWTLHIREGITFHDGTPLDGAAVKFNIDANRAVAVDGWRADADRHGDGVGPGRRDHDQGRPVGGAAELPHVRLDRLHDVARRGWRACRTSRSAPRVDRSTTPRWRRRRPTGTRPPRWGSGRSCSSPTRRATATPSAPCATRTTGAARTASPVRTCPYLDAIEAVAAVDIDSRQNALRSGQFDAMHTANSDAISQLLDDDGLEVSSSSRYGDTSYYTINVAAGPSSIPRAPTRRTRCSTCTAGERSPTPWTASAWSTSAAPAWCCRPTGRSRRGRSATSRTTATPSSTSTWRTRRWTSA